MRRQESRGTFLSQWALALLASQFWMPTVWAGAPRSPSITTRPLIEAEDYYQGRSNLENVRKAISLLQGVVDRDSRDYEAWWRLSEYDCYLARHVPRNARKPILDRGIEAGSHAAQLQSNRPEGHFWEGANEGVLAENSGLISGLRLINPIRREMEEVRKIDPGYQQYGAERILGRLFSEMPFFVGGNKARSIELLKDCLKHYPKNSQTLLFLADAYREDGQRSEAQKTLEEILRLSPDPIYGPEQKDNQAAAKRELEKYFHTN